MSQESSSKWQPFSILDYDLSPSYSDNFSIFDYELYPEDFPPEEPVTIIIDDEDDKKCENVTQKQQQTTHSYPLRSLSNKNIPIGKKIKKETPIPVRKNNTTTTKKHIPIAVKRLVWNRYIGEEIGKSKCYCCRLTDITQLTFHCGHVISEKDGGEIEVRNLRPICQSCNSSMGTTNMKKFIKKFNLHHK